MGINKRAIKAMFPRDKWRVLRGDTVYIAAGRDKGQTGVVTKVIRDRKIPKAFVEGRNLVRSAQRTAELVPQAITSGLPQDSLHFQRRTSALSSVQKIILVA